MPPKIQYLGHATFLITDREGRTLLIDPWVMNNPATPPELRSPASVDVMLITHAHADHFTDAAEIARTHRPAIACILEIAAYLEHMGIENLQAMNKGGGQTVGHVHVTMTDARHSSSIIEEGGKIWDGGEAAGFVIRFEDGFTIYHAGDTCVFSGMSIIAELYKPDLIMLPIGDVFTMGPREAAYACGLLKARKVIPMHYATFPLLTGTPEQFEAEVGEETEVIVMRPGENYEFGGTESRGVS